MAEAAVLTPPKSPPIMTVDESGVKGKILIHGKSGAGKTAQGCLMPKPLILLTEGDVAKPTFKFIERTFGRKIPFWPIRSLKDLSEAYRFLEAGEHEFESAVLDSLTDLNRLVMREVVGDQLAQKAEKNPDILSERDWGIVDQRMRRIITMFRDLDMHVLMLALSMDTEMGIGPMVYPKGLRLHIPAYFNAVAYLGKVRDPNTDKETRALIFDMEGYVGKNPGGLVDNVVLNPNIGDIVKILEEGEA